MAPKVRLLDLSSQELETLMQRWDQPVYRARQVREWLYHHLATNPTAMTNLPIPLRQRLAEETQIEVLTPVTESVSSDGQTVKVLFYLQDGHLIEAVLMQYHRRRTVCISSQVGCAMGCPFCATGQMGLQRNLTPGEIVAQVLYFERRLRRAADQATSTRLPGGSQPAVRRGRRSLSITNVVVMGMGEPLANYHNLWLALRTLTDPAGFGLGARRITVSTVGLVPAIDRFSQEKSQIGLAVSLHAPNDALRNQLVPINRRYPLAEVVAACRRYIRLTNRRVTFEYALMQGVNDSQQTAKELASLLRGLLCHVNLIPLNPVDGSPYQPSPPEVAEAFRQTLLRHGIAATMRVRRGIDIDAGCGQLRARVLAQASGG